MVGAFFPLGQSRRQAIIGPPGASQSGPKLSAWPSLDSPSQQPAGDGIEPEALANFMKSLSRNHHFPPRLYRGACSEQRLCRSRSVCYDLSQRTAPFCRPRCIASHGASCGNVHENDADCGTAMHGALRGTRNRSSVSGRKRPRGDHWNQPTYVGSSEIWI